MQHVKMKLNSMSCGSVDKLRDICSITALHHKVTMPDHRTSSLRSHARNARSVHVLGWALKAPPRTQSRNLAVATQWLPNAMLRVSYGAPGTDVVVHTHPSMLIIN